MNRITSRTPLAALVVLAVLTTSNLAMAQSARNADALPPTPPAAVATQPAKPSPDMQKVLDALAGLGGKPIETLTAAQARLQPSAADGAKAAMRIQGVSTAPDASVVTQDIPYGAHRRQFARIYKPAKPMGNKPMPVVVYYHGVGG